MSGHSLYGVSGKMTRRLAGIVIGRQGLVVFFGALAAWALAAAQGSHTSSFLMPNGALLAVLCVLDAAMLRQQWGSRRAGCCRWRLLAVR